MSLFTSRLEHLKADQAKPPDERKPPVVWMLNPTELNKRSVSPGYVSTGTDEFPLTWYDPRPKETNIGFINICGAWEKDGPGVLLPVAVLATNIDPRMSAQRSCFTVQGKNKYPLSVSLPEVCRTNQSSINVNSAEILRCYEVKPKELWKMHDDLVLLGVGRSTVYPDLAGLAKELEDSC